MADRTWNEIMEPLWFRYPQYCEDSPGLAEGEAGAYAARFAEWKDALSPEEQDEYDRLFPAPSIWSAGPDNRMEHGIFRIPKWQEADLPEDDRSRFREPFIIFENHPEREEQVTKNCLSNWYLEPFRVGEKEYTCVEQYMMEAKALLFGDAETGAEILQEPDPAQIKALGRKIRGFDDVLWNRFKYRIVRTACWFKFACSPDLRAYLLSTDDAVPVEANPSDKIWGAALAADDPAIMHPEKWGGTNLLGIILMEVREELRRVRKNEGLL